MVLRIFKKKKKKSEDKAQNSTKADELNVCIREFSDLSAICLGFDSVSIYTGE